MIFLHKYMFYLCSMGQNKYDMLRFEKTEKTARPPPRPSPDQIQYKGFSASIFSKLEFNQWLKMVTWLEAANQRRVDYLRSKFLYRIWSLSNYSLQVSQPGYNCPRSLIRKRKI